MNVKRLIASFNGLCLAVFIIAGILLVMNTKNFFISWKSPTSFEELLDMDVKEGMHVKGNLAYVYDSFASKETWTESKSGAKSKPKTSSYYYVIPVKDSFIGLEVRSKINKSVSALSDETYDYLLGGAEPTTKVMANGSVTKMSGELAKYFKEWLTSAGVSESDLAAMGDFYMVESWDETAVRGMFAGGIVLVILGILLVRHNYVRRGRLEKQAEEAAAAAAAANEASNPDMERYFNSGDTSAYGTTQQGNGDPDDRSNS